ncbi:MAG TPA: polyprenyl synthetase family protein [Mycobacteriales bacterium]|nr:polyprenyl synthetase family protein [Mycobacteriales bacterium]
MDRLVPPLRLVADYHFGWVDADGADRGGGGGKLLRPALVLLSAAAADGPIERAVPAAVAVELVHNFSLLHDDLMDGDAERRHRPTAWAVFGIPHAVLAGDALLALATDLLLEASAPGERWELRSLTAAVQQLIGGQIEDVRFERRLDVTVTEWLAMAAGKTSALLACAASIGAIAVGGPGALAAALADFGAHLGLAFQLVDDLLGIWGSPRVTGKPVLADLRANKKSAPIVAALRAESPHATRLAELLAPGGLRDEEDVVLAAKLVEAAGGREWAVREAERQLAEALASLDRVTLPAAVRDDLVELARFVTARES